MSFPIRSSHLRRTTIDHRRFGHHEFGFTGSQKRKRPSYFVCRCKSLHRVLHANCLTEFRERLCRDSHVIPKIRIDRPRANGVDANPWRSNSSAERDLAMDRIAASSESCLRLNKTSFARYAW